MEQFIELLVKLHNNVVVGDLPLYARKRNIKNLVHYMYVQGVIPRDVHDKCINYLTPFENIIDVSEPWAVRDYEPNRRLAYELLILAH